MRSELLHLRHSLVVITTAQQAFLNRFMIFTLEETYLTFRDGPIKFILPLVSIIIY